MVDKFMQQRCVHRAESALKEYVTTKTKHDTQTDLVSSLLTDLKHYCDDHAIDFNYAMANAQDNYREETK